jgi:AraC-like DNA-binding protein
MQLNKNYHFHGEAHDFWEINYCDKNEILITVDKEQISLKQGEILFISPDTFHTASGNGKNTANMFIITFECTSEIMSYFIGLHIALPDDLRDLLAAIITEAENAFDLPDFNPELNRLIVKKDSILGGEQIIKNSLEMLLIYLIRRETVKPVSSIAFIEKSDSKDTVDIIIKFLKDHLYDKVSLNDLCELTNYGKTYLCNTFKAKMKTSIFRYNQKLKIEEAKIMIRDNATFKEISNRLCFDSISHFTSVFGQYANMTPKQYKNSILQ